MNKVSKISLLAAALLMSGAASAYEAGDWIVRGGLVMVDPDSDSSELDLGGTSLPDTGVEVDSDTQFLLNVTYMASSHVGVELLAASPFEHDVKTTGVSNLGVAGLNDVDVGKVQHLPPTLSVLWYPLGSDSAFQPFIGGGVNYTVFFKEEVSGEAEAMLGDDNLKLDDSWGLAFRAGFDYMMNDCWSLHAGMYYLQIESEAELGTGLGAPIKVDVDVNPWVYTVGLGYRF